MMAQAGCLGNGVVAYCSPIVRIPFSRYTPWRARKRDDNISCNDEVDSVAGQFYSFTDTFDAHSSLLVSLFASSVLSKRSTAWQTIIAIGVFWLRLLFLDIFGLTTSRYTLGVSGLHREASRLYFFLLLRFVRGSMPLHFDPDEVDL